MLSKVGGVNVLVDGRVRALYPLTTLAGLSPAGRSQSRGRELLPRTWIPPLSSVSSGAVRNDLDFRVSGLRGNP